MDEIAGRIRDLRKFLDEHTLFPGDGLEGCYAFLTAIKRIQGNSHNDVSFVATLMAKRYLQQRFDLREFDAAAKPQSAPGLDIDVRTSSDERVVGEIKTTIPYGRDDLGAQQKTTFRKDFAKLRDAVADHRFMFVTEPATYEILLKTRYLDQLRGVGIVDLSSGREHVA